MMCMIWRALASCSILRAGVKQETVTPPAVDRFYTVPGYIPCNITRGSLDEHNPIQSGSIQFFSPRGAPLGVFNRGMSAVMLTIALEGLSPRYAICVA